MKKQQLKLMQKKQKINLEDIYYERHGKDLQS